MLTKIAIKTTVRDKSFKNERFILDTGESQDKLSLYFSLIFKKMEEYRLRNNK